MAAINDSWDTETSVIHYESVGCVEKEGELEKNFEPDDGLEPEWAVSNKKITLKFINS
jgi:hypothetical protein